VVAGYRWIGPAERERIVTRWRAGESVRELAVEFGCAVRTIQRIGASSALRRPAPARSGRRLSLVERERISRGIAAGECDSEIARALGRHRATVGREIRAGGGRRGYRAVSAERAARRRARRPKAGKLASCPRLLAAVQAGLERRWSPQQIAARLRLDYPDDPVMRISHETIYRSLYVQARGELRRQLAAQLGSVRGSVCGRGDATAVSYRRDRLRRGAPEGRVGSGGLGGRPAEGITHHHEHDEVQAAPGWRRAR
jgi:transposase, IS30 family